MFIKFYLNKKKIISHEFLLLYLFLKGLLRPQKRKRRKIKKEGRLRNINNIFYLLCDMCQALSAYILPDFTLKQTLFTDMKAEAKKK